MTRRHCLTAVAAAATISLAGAALAQDSANASASASSSNAKSAADVTCAELSTMDTATVPGVLYFVAGYSEGERTAKQGQQDLTSDSDAATEGSSAETDTSSNGGSQDATPDATTSTDASSGSNGSQVQIGRMTGYFDIPVEEVVIACEAEPDKRLGDVLTEENQRQSATSSGATETDTGSDTGGNADAGAATDKNSSQ